MNSWNLVGDTASCEKNGPLCKDRGFNIAKVFSAGVLQSSRAWSQWSHNHREWYGIVDKLMYVLSSTMETNGQIWLPNRWQLVVPEFPPQLVISFGLGNFHVVGCWLPYGWRYLPSHGLTLSKVWAHVVTDWIVGYPTWLLWLVISNLLELRWWFASWCCVTAVGHIPSNRVTL